jgi:hypothetical protein
MINLLDDTIQVGDIINFIVNSGSTSTCVTTTTQRINATGASSYQLLHKVGTSLPNEDSMLVRIDQQVLSPGIIEYFTIKNIISYEF